MCSCYLCRQPEPSELETSAQKAYHLYWKTKKSFFFILITFCVNLFFGFMGDTSYLFLHFILLLFSVLLSTHVKRFSMSKCMPKFQFIKVQFNLSILILYRRRNSYHISIYISIFQLSTDTIQLSTVEYITAICYTAKGLDDTWLLPGQNQ